jgi:imidazolonepropionase-like amidohydrolase
MVRQQKTAGWDLLKVHPGLTRATYDSMAGTAKQVGIRFGGHVPADVGLAHAIASGQETFDHLDGYIEYLDAAAKPIDAGKLAEVVKMTRAANAAVVPTMALWEVLEGVTPLATATAYPELKYMPRALVDSWAQALRQRVSGQGFNAQQSRQLIENRMKVLEALHDGGVTILLGTDAPQQFSVPGFSIHREMKTMVAAGMRPYDVLKSGTQNTGAYFKSQANFGTVEVGKRADLILVDANPLTDVANVSRRSGVMVRGTWLPEKEIQSRLARIAGR